MNQRLERNASLEPIVIIYNDTVSVTNLTSIATTKTTGSTSFVKGKLEIFFQ